MGDKTPDRLQAFRDEHAPKNVGLRGSVPSLVVGAVLGIVGALAVFNLMSANSVVPRSGLTTDRIRDLALLYERKDMPDAAIEAHEAYLDQATLSDTERGDVAYSIAKLAMDNTNYDYALKYLYQAELLAPDSPVRDDRSRQIVHCLEQLGRSYDLRRELKTRTDPASQETTQPGATVIAKFGNEVVTDRDLSLRLEEVPANVRDAFSTPEKQIELLKNIVAERKTINDEVN